MCQKRSFVTNPLFIRRHFMVSNFRKAPVFWVFRTGNTLKYFITFYIRNDIGNAQVQESSFGKNETFLMG